MADKSRLESLKQDRLASDPDYFVRYFRDRYKRLKPKIREQQAAYYKANPKAIRERAIAWGRENQEKAKSKYATWRMNNPDKIKIHVHRRRAWKLKAEGSHTAADLMSIMNRQDGRCPWCSTDIRSRYDVDHMVPLSRGGGNGPDNIALLCRSCNTSKGKKTPDEFRAWLKRPR